MVSGAGLVWPEEGINKHGQSARRSAVLFAIFKMHFFTSYPQNCGKRMILDTYHQKLLTCTCAKTWNRALKNECFHQNSLCFPMYSLEFQNFFSTFHAVCLDWAYPGSWKRGPHWSDATVHAIGISTMRFLWFSLWIAGYMLRQRTWRYHTHPTPPQPHPTCRRVSNVASVAVHVCRKCIYMNVAQRSRSYNTPAYMTLSHPPHTQGQRWWKECEKMRKALRSSRRSHHKHSNY